MLRVPVDGVAEHRADLLAAEEPLEIRVAGTPLAVTMRTPGADFDLVHGHDGLVARAPAGLVRADGPRSRRMTPCAIW